VREAKILGSKKKQIEGKNKKLFERGANLPRKKRTTVTDRRPALEKNKAIAWARTSTGKGKKRTEAINEKDARL